MFWNVYPYQNLQDLNLDYVLRKIKALTDEMKTFVNVSAIKYANPIQWSITTQYEQNTVVIDPKDNTAYLSVQPVPSGVSIENTDYWTPVFNLSYILDMISDTLSAIAVNEGESEYATQDFVSGDLVIVDGALYRVITDMAAGTRFIAGTNVTRTTVAAELKTLDAYVTAELTRVITELETELETAVTQMQSDLANAINDINDRIDGLIPAWYTYPEEYGAKGDGVTDDTQAVQDCINGADGKTVVFRNTYKIGNVTIPSNSYLKFLTESRIIETLDGSGGLWGIPRYFEILNAENVVIDGLTVVGTSGEIQLATPALNAVLVYAKNSKRFEIMNCKFIGTDSSAAICAEGCSDFEIHNNYVSFYRSIGIGVLAVSTRFRIYNNFFYGAGVRTANTATYGIIATYIATGEVMHNTEFQINDNLMVFPNDALPTWDIINTHGGIRFTVGGNTIFGATRAGIGTNSQGSGSSLVLPEDYVISGNYIRGAAAAALEIGGADMCGIMAGGYNVVITGNVLIKCGASTRAAESGDNTYHGAITVSADAQYMAITNNQIIQPTGHGICFYCPNSASYKMAYCEVAGNTISNITKPSDHIGAFMRLVGVVAGLNVVRNNTFMTAGAQTNNIEETLTISGYGRWYFKDNVYLPLAPLWTGYDGIIPDYVPVADIATPTLGATGAVIRAYDAAAGQTYERIWRYTGAYTGAYTSHTL